MACEQVYIHLVFTTKNRKPVLINGVRQKIFKHIYDNAKSKGIRLLCVNGYTNHVHCLIALDGKSGYSEIVMLIKGESSFWINKNQLLASHFKWQRKYWVASVNYNGVDGVWRYIKNQEAHHKKQNEADELSQFLRENGLDDD